MNTSTKEIEYIKELLPILSETELQEVRDFMAYLIDRDRRRKAFEERTDRIERESDTVTFKSVEEAMKAIRNWNE